MLERLWRPSPLRRHRARLRPLPMTRHSPPFDVDQVVAGVYEGLLGRSPDPQGLAAHGTALRRSAGVAYVVSEIAASDERAEVVIRGDDLRRLAGRAWRTRRSDERPLFHLHTMKTGGTSLLQGLCAIAGDRLCVTGIYLDHLVTIPRPVLHNAALVEGHMGTEALEFLAPDTDTVIVVREPVARTLSHWVHVRNDPSLGKAAKDLPLWDFVHNPRWRPLSSNVQARNLVHRVGASRAWLDFAPEQRRSEVLPDSWQGTAALPLQSTFELSPMEITGGELISAALARLDDVEYVGITEDLDGLFRVLAQRWGVHDSPGLEPVNVSATRVSPEDIPRSLYEAILEANDADLALYERAKHRAASYSSYSSRR